MIFQEKHPDTGETVWGCPRLSSHGAGWLIDWFRADGGGLADGSSVAKGAELEWIKANPQAVLEMQVQLDAWQAKQIPF